jgi:hypothetical protein
MLKILLIYSHLLATCIAIGVLLQADHKLWCWRKQLLNRSMREQLLETQKIVSWALLFLWATGLILILLGYLDEGVRYLLNEKLWAKFSVVVLLSLNGLLLHKVGFPLLQKAPFICLPRAARTRLGLMGALSTSGWLFAALLGVARPWNHVVPYHFVMGGFSILLLLASAVAFTVASSAGVAQPRTDIARSA